MRDEEIRIQLEYLMKRLNGFVVSAREVKHQSDTGVHNQRERIEFLRASLPQWTHRGAPSPPGASRTRGGPQRSWASARGLAEVSFALVPVPIVECLDVSERGIGFTETAVEFQGAKGCRLALGHDISRRKHHIQ